MNSDSFTLNAGDTGQVLVLPPPESDLGWYCLHTRPRCEKKVSAACALRSISSYLPLRKSVRYYGGHRREHAVPYFPGYVFCCASPEQRYSLVCTSYLVNALPVHDQEDLLRDLYQIEHALQVSADLETFPYISQGRRVRVIRGPFRGVEGVIARSCRGYRVVLNVEFIQRALALEVDAEHVEPVA